MDVGERPMDAMPRLREFLDAFLVPWHVAAAIALGSGGLLALRSYGIADLSELPNWLFGLVWILLVYAGVVLLIRLAQSSGEGVERRRKKRRRRRWINDQLDTLGEKEREVFVFMLANNQRSVTGRIIAEHFAPLMQKGLLIRASGSYSILDWPHTVPDDVWNELVRRRSEFE